MSRKMSNLTGHAKPLNNKGILSNVFQSYKYDLL
jgi:hypothetical protein